MRAEGMKQIDIAATIGVHRNIVSNIVGKYEYTGFEYAINNHERGGNPVLTDDKKARIISLACSRPRDLGYTQKLWTYKNLRQRVRKHCQENGHQNLDNISNSTIHEIMHAKDIKSHWIQ